jgi:uncharacterized 2Fe-2S/4Fe-4S cluster protein (DUF4445 family)
MAKVVFNPGGQTVHVDKGTTILQAARKAGVVIESPAESAK